MLYIKEEYSRDKYISIYLSIYTYIQQTILLKCTETKVFKVCSIWPKKKLTSQETGKCNLYFKQNI